MGIIGGGGGEGERGERIGKWKREGEGERIMQGNGRVGDGKEGEGQ